MEERNTGHYLNTDTTVRAYVEESALWNDSDWAVFYPSFNNDVLITKILEFIIALVGLAGNAVVLCLLGFRLQKTAFSVYVLNLAGADFVFLFVWIIFSLRNFSEAFHFISISHFSLIMLFFAYIAGLSILSAISAERCLSVLQPIWYHCRRPKNTTWVMCALLWALSLLLTILNMEFCGHLFGERNEYFCKLHDFSIATWLIFSFVLLFGSSLVLLTRLLCGFRKMKLTRLCITTGLTVLVFLLCGLPWGINCFLILWMTREDDENTIRFYLVTEALSCVNSCVNPIIYFFVGSYRQQQRQKRSLKLILQRALQDGTEEDGNQGSSPQETLEMAGNSLAS